MKNLIIATTLTLASASSFAYERCEYISEVATVLMENRQLGASMAKMMEIMVKDESDVLYKEMVIKAYEVPQYQVAKNQQREINDFANNWYLACVKAK